MIISDNQAETCLIITINDTSTGDLPLIITISDTCKNQAKRLDFDNTINLSSLIVILGHVTPRGSGAHEDGMTYTDSEDYSDNQTYVSDTISDASGDRTDAPGTPDAGQTTDDGCESPILFAHPVRCASPSYVSPCPRRRQGSLSSLIG